MSEFDEKYNKIIEDISKNIKDEKELQFVKEKMNELSAIFINMFNQVNNSSEKRITDLEKNQKGLEEKINKVEKFIEDMKKDIYDEYDEEDEMIKKQNDGSMIVNGLTELEDLEDLIPVTFDKEDYETLNGFPECHNIIELDWNLDDCESGCSSCHGCSSCGSHGIIDEEDDDDENDEDM